MVISWEKRDSKSNFHSVEFPLFWIHNWLMFYAFVYHPVTEMKNFNYVLSSEHFIQRHGLILTRNLSTRLFCFYFLRRPSIFFRLTGWFGGRRIGRSVGDVYGDVFGIAIAFPISCSIHEYLNRKCWTSYVRFTNNIMENNLVLGAPSLSWLSSFGQMAISLHFLISNGSLNLWPVPWRPTH